MIYFNSENFIRFTKPKGGDMNRKSLRSVSSSVLVVIGICIALLGGRPFLLELPEPEIYDLGVLANLASNVEIVQGDGTSYHPPEQPVSEAELLERVRNSHEKLVVRWYHQGMELCLLGDTTFSALVKHQWFPEPRFLVDYAEVTEGKITFYPRRYTVFLVVLITGGVFFISVGLGSFLTIPKVAVRKTRLHPAVG